MKTKIKNAISGTKTKVSFPVWIFRFYISPIFRCQHSRNGDTRRGVFYEPCVRIRFHRGPHVGPLGKPTWESGESKRHWRDMIL
jgi:hypothetical protein